MKQLTNEQHETICLWLASKIEFAEPCITDLFTEEFPPSCCDSCADGEHCESDTKSKPQKIEITGLDFDSVYFHNPKPIEYPETQIGK